MRTTFDHRASRWHNARFALLAVTAVICIALGISACGTSVDPTLKKQAGVHGTALEKVYALYTKDVLAQASTRDLKAINAALAASDLKKATKSDVRQAEAAIRARMKTIQAYGRQLKTANQQLKNTPPPDWSTGLNDSVASKQFAGAYTKTTQYVEGYTTRGLATLPLAYASLQKYEAFLKQWEQYLANGDTNQLLSTGQASDKALARLKAADRREKRGSSLSQKIGPQVDAMASAASDSSELTDLIDELKKDYPKSFLSVHIVEKK